ncbi:MAG: N-6 DNA methylase [Cyanobacteria bacterium RU_5_0]|nr:N-6 DNA methylase [Cyanobacteria bacterium RU_5_0]
MLTSTVQMIILRLILLRFCEGRGIEPNGQLLECSMQHSVYDQLCQIFQRAGDRYHSGLFSKSENDQPNLGHSLLNLTIGNEPLQQIIQTLYHHAYDFSAIPIEFLGRVYEQWLSKELRWTGDQMTIADQPAARKANGVYYTPSYIVDDIVEHTIGRLLNGKTPKQVETIRILDPACGCGSFLIRAYQFLLDWYLSQYRAAPEKYERYLDRQDSNWQLSFEEKKRILVAHIFGIDIDQKAVEITKLSLLLQGLARESKASLFDSTQRNFPNLEKNLRCGNALMKSNFYETTEANGFDGIIGNPPYGASLFEAKTCDLAHHFQLQNYQHDTYLLFLEQALNNLNTNGWLGIIIPNTWRLNLSTKTIRKYIIHQTQIDAIVHHRYPIFSKAIVDTEIIILAKSQPVFNHQIQITIAHTAQHQEMYLIPQNRWQTLDGQPINIFERPELTELADKLKQFDRLDQFFITTQGAKPFQVGKGKPPQTRSIVEAKPFVATTKRDDTFRPLLRGSLIQRYQILWNQNYWISFGNWLAEPRYSAQYDADEKIVIRQTGDSLIATLDDQQFIVRDNLYTIVPRDHGERSISLKYALALINSRLLNWFYQTILNPERGEALAQVKRGHIAQLPIATVQLSDGNEQAKHDRFVLLVERLLLLHKQPRTTGVERQMKAIEHQIDRLVYEMYELTEDEIAIVELSS